MLRIYSLMIFLTISLAPASIHPQERLLVSYAGFGGFQAPAWAAQDTGLFAKYGLTTELVMIPGSARGTQALLGGSTQFGQIDGTALISAIAKEYLQARRSDRQESRYRRPWRRARSFYGTGAQRMEY